MTPKKTRDEVLKELTEQGWTPIDDTGEEAFWEACITHAERFSYD